MAEKFTRWDASCYLKTEQDGTAYFEACLDDDPGDGNLLLFVVYDISAIKVTMKQRNKLWKKQSSKIENETRTLSD